MPVSNANPSAQARVEGAEKTLVLSRVFDAPRALVFKVWIDAKHFAQWWGPHGFTNPICDLDVRPGGAIHVDMRGPDGTVYPMGGTFEEIDEPGRLVFLTMAMEDANGEWQMVNRNTVTFTDLNGKTRVDLEVRVLKATLAVLPALAGMDAGWSQSLERLAELVVVLASGHQIKGASVTENTKDREITATRVFDAPRELVFDMWTRPEHIVKWWGPTGFRNTVFVMDVRPGGEWRHVLHGPNGVDYKNEAVYLNVERPSLLVYHHISPPSFVSCVTFEEEEGKTRVTVSMVFETVAVRDATVKAHNAIVGLGQTLDRLAEQLAQR